MFQKHQSLCHPLIFLFTSYNKQCPLRVEINASNFDAPEEKQRLTDRLHHAVRNVGFYIIRRHGSVDEEVLEIGNRNTLFHYYWERKGRIRFGRWISFWLSLTFPLFW
jgi:hypothetical protein